MLKTFFQTTVAVSIFLASEHINSRAKAAWDLEIEGDFQKNNKPIIQLECKDPGDQEHHGGDKKYKYDDITESKAVFKNLPDLRETFIITLLQKSKKNSNDNEPKLIGVSSYSYDYKEIIKIHIPNPVSGKGVDGWREKDSKIAGAYKFTWKGTKVP